MLEAQELEEQQYRANQLKKYGEKRKNIERERKVKKRGRKKERSK
jgi:hypothetical protein